MGHRWLSGVWLLGLLLAAGWVAIELYRAAWLHDLSLTTVTLLLFWLFVGRRAWKYLVRSIRMSRG